MPTTSWQIEEVAHTFLDERRQTVPYAADQIEMMLRLVRRFRPEPRVIADLGCGDGILARALLAIYPEARAVLIDHSEPMLARAREAVATPGGCQIVLADLAEPLNSVLEPGSVDVVLSGYAIHHLPHARKRLLYGEIFDALAPGGLFVNVEHVASASPQIEAFWDDSFIESISRRTGKPHDAAAREYHARPDKADNILAPVEEQVGWLCEIGFVQADCYFKFLELAVFGGVKPTAN